MRDPDLDREVRNYDALRAAEADSLEHPEDRMRIPLVPNPFITPDVEDDR